MSAPAAPGKTPGPNDNKRDNAWVEKPWISMAIKCAVVVLPLLLSLLITWLVASLWGAPTSIVAAIVRFLSLGFVAIGVAVVAERGARRFLPLAALYRLSLAFPGETAPVRFAIALRAGNTKRIEARLKEVETSGFTGSQADAASFIVEIAAALSEHDRLTRGHSERVRAFTDLIAEEMGLSAEDSNKLQWAALVHDVGKLRIDQDILTKPGRLTDEEFEIIKTHPAQGMQIAEPLREYLGEWIGAVGEHHERFDGTGYPNGLAGTDISLAGRIVAVADVYDVITAARSYKKPQSPEFARQELANNAGTQFDPEVVRAFLNIGVGRLRTAMWPLSWAAQLPFIGTAITAPVATTVATAAVTVASVTGVTAATDGFEPFTVPEAIAMVDESSIAVDDPIVVTSEPSVTVVASTASSTAPTVSSPPSSILETESTTTAVVSTTNSPESTSTSIDGGSTTIAPSNTIGTFVPGPTVPPLTNTAPTTNAPGTTAAPTASTRKPNIAPPTTALTTTVPPRTSSSTTTTALTTTTVRPELSDCEQARAGRRELAGADLRHCNLSGLTLTNATLTNADLSGATLRETIITGGDFLGAKFTKANFTDAVLEDVDFSSADETTTVLAGANFTQADLFRVQFVGTELNDSNFSNSTVQAVDFTDATGSPVGLAPDVAQRVRCPNGNTLGKNTLDETVRLQWCWRVQTIVNSSTTVPVRTTIPIR